MEWQSFPTFSAIYEDNEILVGFDSGHTETFLDYSWKEKVAQTTSTQTSIYGVGSHRTEQTSNIDSFTIHICGCPITLQNIEIVDHEIYGTTEGDITILLGADILKNAVWKLDFQSGYFNYSRK